MGADEYEPHVFIGHALLAFALVASGAAVMGWSSRRATAIGVVAAAFATLPDVDMVYPMLAFLIGIEDLLVGNFRFWDYVAITHRTVTHSLVVGTVATLGFGVWARSGRSPLTTATCLLGCTVTVVGVAVWNGPLSGIVMGLFVVGGALVTMWAVLMGFGPRHVAGAAGVGLLSHPLGDLFTVPIPDLLYPFELPWDFSYVALHSDPTLHLLIAFFVELGTIWLALGVYARLHGWSLVPAIRPRAALGIAYGASVFVIPAPSLDVPTPFVLSVLAVGVLAIPLRPATGMPRRWQVPLTALAAVTAAALAYTGAYLLVF